MSQTTSPAVDTSALFFFALLAIGFLRVIYQLATGKPVFGSSEGSSSSSAGSGSDDSGGGAGFD